MKNDIFNIRRFGRYFAADLKTCTSNFGLTLITTVLLTYLGVYFGHGISGLIFNHVWIHPQAEIRTLMFMIIIACIIISAPVKCYGKLTEKQYGTFWLTIPSSGFEKFLSMILLSSFIIPLAGAALYLATDALFCIFDPKCGENVFISMHEFTKAAFDPYAGTIEEGGRVFTVNIKTLLKTPWLFADDLFGITLPFILGGILFKNGKTVKTFLCLAALSSLFGAVALPLLTDFIEGITEITMNGDVTIAQLQAFFDNSFMNHIPLWDTINDTMVNLAFLIAIYFRIKTLKH